MTLCLDVSEWKFSRSGAFEWFLSHLDSILLHHSALEEWQQVVLLADPERPLDPGGAAKVRPLSKQVGRRPWSEIRGILSEITGSNGLVFLQGDSLWLDEHSLKF